MANYKKKTAYTILGSKFRDNMLSCRHIFAMAKTFLMLDTYAWY